MKKLIFISCFIFLLPNRILAYPNPGKDTTGGNLYFIWKFGAGDFLHPITKGKMLVSFPYTSTAQFGATTHNTFRSRPVSPYATNEWMFCVLNFEIGKLDNFFDVRIFAGSKSDAVNFTFGYGQNIYFDLFNKTNRPKKSRTFVLKPAISIGYCQYGSPGNNKESNQNYLGNIDNQNKTLHFLGYPTGPSFTYSYCRYSSSTATETSKTVDIYYAQNDWAIIPKISLCNAQYKHWFHWGALLSYTIPFSERGGIQLFRNDWKSIKSPGVIGLSEKNITTTLNGDTIVKSPYKFSGLFIGLTLGFNLSSDLMKRHQSNKKYLHLKDNIANRS